MIRNYEGALNKALDMVGYKKLRAEQAEARKQGRLMASVFPPTSRFAPLAPRSHARGRMESATVRVEPTGGHGAHRLLTARPGTGNIFAQIAADHLGWISPLVTVITRHFDRAVRHRHLRSRATAVGGTASGTRSKS